MRGGVIFKGEFMRLILFVIVMFGLMTIKIYAGTDSEDSLVKNTGLLDGKVFIGTVGFKGGEANGEDEVIFQNGEFISIACMKWGFGPAPYTASREGDKVVFKAVMQSSKHGHITWYGQVKDDKLEATYIWTKKRWYWFDAHEESWLKANLKKK